ncbi:HAMP domain-containing protein [Nitriliruptoraceae bacterium ZYF776]|nr:HAMP domain-containing protein [Profundirhabdus halotolerans]
MSRLGRPRTCHQTRPGRNVALRRLPSRPRSAPPDGDDRSDPRPARPPVSISHRLRLVVLVALAAALLIGVTAQIALVVVQNEVTALVDEELPLAELHDEMLQALTDAETAERGYLITGEEVSLEPYERGLRRFRNAAAEALRRTDDAALAELLTTEREAGERWITTFADPVIEQRRADEEGALARAATGEGRELFTTYRNHHRATQQALDARVVDRETRVDRTGWIVRVALLLMLLVGGGAAGIVGVRTFRAITGPLDRLVAALDRLRRDRSVRAEVGGPSEIRAVGDAVNELAEENERYAEQRQQVLERLQELDQQKSDFVSTVSHELRTPLTSIIGYHEMLADGDAGELTEDQADLLAVAERNAQRLLALIEDMLTLSRIESGKLRAASDPVDVAALARDAARELEPRTHGRDLALTVDLGDDLGTVTGDPAHLERVLFNLVGNALKFSPDGGEVRLRARRVDGEVTLQVSDQGIGIPAEEQAQLFQRFYRASTATDRAIPGTGLGLAITKLLVEQHGGRIAVESRPGSGTTFTVTLPATAEEAIVP